MAHMGTAQHQNASPHSKQEATARSTCLRKPVEIKTPPPYPQSSKFVVFGVFFISLYIDPLSLRCSPKTCLKSYLLLERRWEAVLAMLAVVLIPYAHIEFRQLFANILIELGGDVVLVAAAMPIQIILSQISCEARNSRRHTVRVRDPLMLRLLLLRLGH